MMERAKDERVINYFGWMVGDIEDLVMATLLSPLVLSTKAKDFIVLTVIAYLLILFGEVISLGLVGAIWI